MSNYEFIQETAPTGEIFHRVKTKDSKTGEVIIYGSLFEKPIDDPLTEIINDFNIPIIRIPGRQYKIRFIARKDIIASLHMERYDLNYPEKVITWIDHREIINRKKYNKQVSCRTQFYMKKGGRDLILYSISDAIQILSIKQHEKEKGELIRKLIIKLRELQKKLTKHQKEQIEFLRESLEKLDDIAHEWLKEHGVDKFHGYKMLWETTIWELTINVHYRIRKILGLTVPKRENTGLHHADRPYYKVYPHVATKGRLVDKRFDHDDSRQRKFKI